MAIIEYDHSPNISPEQRLRSLADSVRRAFEEIESDTKSYNHEAEDDSKEEIRLGAVATEDVVPIKKGGTEAETAAAARQNINYIGGNPISASANDTPVNWADMGNGVAYYNTEGCLVNQPSRYGFLYNFATNGTSAAQIWISISSTIPKMYFRQGAGDAWYNNWYEVKTVVERNADYPAFNSYWRWEKYSDGTFKAEYKRSISTGTLSESSAIDNLMYYSYAVNLPFTAESIDTPKWSHSNNTGLVWVVNTGTESTSSITARIIRAIASTNAISLNLGCTVTGRWQ